MSYQPPPFLVDETTAIESTLAAIAARIDGWVPSDNSPETVFAEVVGIATATAGAEYVKKALDAWIGFAENLLQVTRNRAQPATTTSTWTLSTSDGLLIPAGTEVEATQPDGTTVDFAVATTVTIPATTMIETGVPLIALDAGAATNGATNPASQDALAGVVSVTIETPSANGFDDESDTDYANAAVKANRRGHDIPFTPADYADVASNVPGVARCAVINLLDPANPLDISPGHITLYPVDATGAVVSDVVKTAIGDLFAAVETPLNVTVHIEDPTYVSFAVTATVTAEADADDTVVHDACVAAIQALINPATFDADEDEDGGWANPRSTKVTTFDVAAALDDIAGLRAVTAVTVNGSTSITFTDPVTLPQLSGTPTVTVS